MNEFIPSEFFLGQNYPNPFKEKTILKYCIAYKTKVKLTIYNSERKVIEKLVDEEKQPGTYEIEFHSAAGNKHFAIGTYFYCLEAGDYKSEKKMEIKK